MQTNKEGYDAFMDLNNSKGNITFGEVF